MNEMPACKDCTHFHVGTYTYLCTAPAIAKTRIDPIDGKTEVTGAYPSKLRGNADQCGPEGKWFEPYPYVLPKITGASPFLKALIPTAPLFGFIFLGALLSYYHQTVLLAVLALLTLLSCAVLLGMIHERDDPS